MKFSCEKSFLQNAINTTSRATAAKSAVVALEGLLIEAGSFVSISGYNLKTGIRAEIPADVQDEGSIVLNSRLFGEIVRRFDDDIVTVESNENLIVKISCGMSEFEIMGISANDYPELPTVESQSSFIIPRAGVIAVADYCYIIAFYNICPVANSFIMTDSCSNAVIIHP